MARFLQITSETNLSNGIYINVDLIEHVYFQKGTTYTIRMIDGTIYEDIQCDVCGIPSDGMNH